MPSIGSMLEVVDLLQVKAIEATEERCVAVRNRNSHCRKCVEACINDAITVSHNELTIDASLCVNCGCCIAVCPTAVLHAVEPTAARTMDALHKASDPASGLAVIACARKAAKKQGDPDKFAEVPCLGHLNEADLLRLVAEGYDDIVAVDGDCASCKYGAASSRINATVETAREFVETASSDALITRTSDFPPEVVLSDKSRLRGKSRRGLISQTGSYMRTVAGNVAQKTLDEQLGNRKEPMTLKARLNAGKNGRIPPFEPKRNYRIVEDMEHLLASTSADESNAAAADEHAEWQAATQPPVSERVLDTRHFGVVEIDPAKCSGCGMCILFCPTAALQYAEYDSPEDESMRYVEFQCADCTQCMLCRDVCLRDCLEVRSDVPFSELLDFDPQLLLMPRPQNRTSLTMLGLRNNK